MISNDILLGIEIFGRSALTLIALVGLVREVIPVYDPWVTVPVTGYRDYELLAWTYAGPKSGFVPAVLQWAEDNKVIEWAQDNNR